MVHITATDGTAMDISDDRITHVVGHAAQTDCDRVHDRSRPNDTR
jgi:hypothetical protein